MKLLFGVVGLISLVDGTWLAIAPPRWERCWGSAVKAIGKNRALATGVAAAEVAIGLYLIKDAWEHAQQA